MNIAWRVDLFVIPTRLCVMRLGMSEGKNVGGGLA